MSSVVPVRFGSSEFDRVIAVADEQGFSGVVRVDLADGSRFEHAAGFADRRCGVEFATETSTAIASGTKTFTALTVLALVERGILRLDTTARSLLGTDLPLIHDAVTVADLLAHRSGIGDYYDEDELGEITDYVLAIPPHRLDSQEAYLAVLDGWPQVSPPGDRFSYNNGGFVVLGLLAERAAGRPFADLVTELVCRPADLESTRFVRSDSLPSGTATGYLHRDGMQTNALHIPLVGGGDGGLYSTVADIHRLWSALVEGRVVSSEMFDEMTTRRSFSDDREAAYGFGVWLDPVTDWVRLEGYDAGISFRSWHQRSTGVTHTVIGNWSDAAWPVSRALAEILGPIPP